MSLGLHVVGPPDDIKPDQPLQENVLGAANKSRRRSYKSVGKDSYSVAADGYRGLYRRLAQTRRLRNATSDALTRERPQELSRELERPLAAIENRDADAHPAQETIMTDDHAELRRKLAETTRRFEQAGDLEENALLGTDVRELERLVEIAADQDPNSPRDPSRHL